jgi:pilus assembly protein Flp/PilA
LEIEMARKFNIFARRFLRDEGGATAVEYAIVASLIAGAIILALENLGGALSNVFTHISDRL